MNQSRSCTSGDSHDTDHPSWESIAVILPVRNSLPYLKNALDAIDRARGRYPGEVCIIAVDHESSDGSFRYLEDNLAPQDTLIRSGASNVAGVRNEGAEKAEATYLAFIDSDTVIPNEYFTEAVTVLYRTTASATGAMVRVPRSEGRLAHVWYSLQQNPESGPVHYLNSANFFVDRFAFNEVGGFDDSLKSGEDSDICMRLREMGHRIIESLALTSDHLDNPTSLPTFFKQQVWHAQGMLSTVRLDEVNKPLAATLGYGFAAVSPAVLGLYSGGRLSVWGAVVLIALATTSVSAAAAGYRMIRARRLVAPLTAIGLFHVYFISRWVALTNLLIAQINSFRQTLTYT